MIGGIAHLALCEAGALVRCLGQVDIPDGVLITDQTSIHAAARLRRLCRSTRHLPCHCRPRPRGRSPWWPARCSPRSAATTNVDPLVARRCKGDGLAVGRGGVELSVRRIHRQGWEDAGQRLARRGLIDQARRPGLAQVGAACDVDVVTRGESGGPSGNRFRRLRRCRRG